MNILAMGSCRVDYSCLKAGIPIPNLQGRYSTTDHLQGLQILRKQRTVPAELRDYCLFGNPRAPDRYMSLKDFSGVRVDRAILEICKMQSVLKDGHVLMNYGTTGWTVPELDGVTVHRESVAELHRNLDSLHSELDCPMLLMTPSCGFISTACYEMAAAVSSWCDKRKQAYFNPDVLTIRYGRSRCFLKEGSDIYHFTDFMQEQVGRVFSQWMAEPDKFQNHTTWRNLP